MVQGLARGWPPPNLMLADIPWSYNYAAHLWVLAAHETCGIAVGDFSRGDSGRSSSWAARRSK